MGDVYVRQPAGYERGDRGKVCRLIKARYVTKQASREWSTLGARRCHDDQARVVVRYLLYLATCTRPEISFDVGKLSRYIGAPTQTPWGVAKVALRYLRGTRDWGLV